MENSPTPAPRKEGPRPISEAPKTGVHILGTTLGGNGFGYFDGAGQDWFAVIHWWDNPGEEGWYLSSGGADECAVHPTHFYSLDLAPLLARAEMGKRLVEALREVCNEWDMEILGALAEEKKPRLLTYEINKAKAALSTWDSIKKEGQP